MYVFIFMDVSVSVFARNEGREREETTDNPEKKERKLFEVKGIGQRDV